MSSVVPVEEFLASLSPEARAMTQRLRRLIREVSPAVRERAERETRSLRYFLGERPGDGVLDLAPDGNDVLLSFERSQALPDPRRLLNGDGAGRGEVRLTASGAFDEPYFRSLLEAAFTSATRTPSRRSPAA
ncbi:MAG TPA: hypothetical protein VIC28_06290 [Thermoanaerobaculia bacterium]|jgi:hypothetical protein